MSNPNTYQNISGFVNTVWEDSMLVARENNVMAGLVNVFRDINGMAVRSNAKYGSATINQIGETDDLSSQLFHSSVDQTLTPYEYGAQFFITDQRMESDIYSVRQDATLELGGALGTKVDSYLCGLFSSLTAGTTGAGTATDLTWSALFAAHTLLVAKKAPGPFNCVLHPYQYHCLGTVVLPGVTVTNAQYIADEVARRYYVASFSNVDIFLDANIPLTGDYAYGAMFSRNAIALDWRRAPRIEPERDASRRGFELNLSAIFAYGVWRPQYGVCIQSAGTVPV